MTADRALRDAILDLVKLCKHYQVRALSLNTALTVLMQIRPTKRENLTADDIDAEIRKARDQATDLTNEISAQLERALAGDKEFLLPLELYVRHPRHENLAFPVTVHLTSEVLGRLSTTR